MYRLATCRHPIYHCDMADRFGALASLTIGEAAYRIFTLSALADQGSTDLDRLPFSIRVLLESLLRLHDGKAITEQHVLDLAGWQARSEGARPSVPFRPARVVMQDFTGVPAVVDLGAMREALAAAGGDPRRVNPIVPVDLVIDHSVQVDHFGDAAALALPLTQSDPDAHDRGRPDRQPARPVVDGAGSRDAALARARARAAGLRVVPVSYTHLTLPPILLV